MDTTELRRGLTVLAEDAPGESGLRDAVNSGVVAARRRRRTLSVVAAAAVVALAAGGIGTVAALSHRSAGPTTAPIVQKVPEVPIPPGSRLIRYNAPEQVSPVSVVAPGRPKIAWYADPGRLVVSFFRDFPSIPALLQDDAPVTSAPSFGYSITDGPDEHLHTLYGANLDLTRRPITVGGHPAEIVSAGSGTFDDFGLPAETRITWRLADGRYIHLWADTSSPDGPPDPAILTDFAASVTETPTVLTTTAGIGLTLPGLQQQSSSNSPVFDYSAPPQTLLCPSGVLPSGSAGGVVAPEAYNRCISAMVAMGPIWSDSEPATVTVLGQPVQVYGSDQTAIRDWQRGLQIVVSAPAYSDLSDAELAALAASVTVDPGVSARRTG